MAGPGGREVGRVSIRLVPDSSNFTIDLKPQLARIEATNVVNIRAELDTSGLVTHAKAAVAEANAAAGNVHVGVEVDKAGFAAATSSVGALAASIIVLGPALVPVGAALVGAFFPLVAIFGAATAGAAAFGAVLIPQITEIVKARKAQAQAETQYANATTKAGRVAALKAEKNAMAALTPVQLQAANAIDALGSVFRAFQDALAPKVLPVFTQALGLLAKAIPALTPFVAAAADVFKGLLSEIGKFGSSKEGKSLVAFFSAQVGPAIFTLGQVVGNVFVGIFALLRAFGPLILPIERALVSATGAFATFGQTATSSTGFQAFLAYVQKIGPQVVAFLSSFIGAASKLVAGLAPLGGPILVGVTALFNGFASLPTGVVTALAVAIVSVVAALTLVNVVTAVWTALTTLASAATAIWTGIQWLLNAAFAANPIGIVVVAVAALVAGIIIAYKSSARFRAIVVGAFDAVKNAIVTAVNAVVGFVKAHWPLLLGLLAGPFGLAVALIVTHWGQIKHAVSSGVSAVVGFVKGLPAKIVGALGNLGKLLFNAGKQIIQGLIDGIKSMIGAVGSAIKGVAGKIAGFLPGSPVKTGPLKVLNNGYAGGQIVKMLTDGVAAQSNRGGSAMARLLSGAVPGGAAAAGAGGGHSFTINAAPNVPTQDQILTALARAEALHFSPA